MNKLQHGSAMAFVNCSVTKSSPINVDKGGEEENYSRRYLFATTKRIFIHPNLYPRECLHSWHIQSHMQENTFSFFAAF